MSKDSKIQNLCSDIAKELQEDHLWQYSITLPNGWTCTFSYNERKNERLHPRRTLP